MSDTGHGHVAYVGLSFTIVKRLFADNSLWLGFNNLLDGYICPQFLRNLKHYKKMNILNTVL